jgi:peptide/nickel transport system substrate-binding protein
LEWRKQSLLFIQSQLNQLNIKTNINHPESAAFYGEVLPKGNPEEYGIAEFGFLLSFDPDQTGLTSCTQIPSEANNFAGQNYSFYCNEDLEPLLTEQLAEVDVTKRQAIFKKIFDILLEDLPFIGLAETSHPGVVKKTGRNYAVAPMGSYESVNLYKWWCVGGKC